MEAFCRECPLAQSATQPVYGCGPDDADVMLVGEAPGRTEDSKGRPFVGEAGKMVLNPILHDNGLRRRDVFLQNVLLCRPPENRIDSPEARVALKICPRHVLFPTVEKVRPKVILALGTTAYRVLVGQRTAMSSVRGVVMEQTVGDHTCYVIPTYHPAAALPYRNPMLRSLISYDMARALRVAAGEPARIEPHYFLLDDFEEAQEFLTGLRDYRGSLTIDVEAALEDPSEIDEFRDKVLGIGFSWKPGYAAYVPVRHQTLFSYALTGYWGDHQDDILTMLRVVVEGPAPKNGQNLKYDIKMLENDLGMRLANWSDDTMYASHNLDENQYNHGMGAQVDLYLPEFRGYKKQANVKNMAGMSREAIGRYCCQDCDAEAQLLRIHQVRMERDELARKIYREYTMPLAKVLLRMEQVGAPVDVERAKQIGSELLAEKVRLEKEMRARFGRTVNVNSTPELLYALQQEGVDLDLITERDFKGNPILDDDGAPVYRTDRQHLEIIRENSPLAAVALDLRVVQKLHGTYVDAIIRRAVNGRIHGNFLTVGTVTGRLASSRPNLQNIPRGGSDETNLRDYWGAQVKGIYRTSPGWVLLQADVSQGEVRMLGEYSGDEKLIRACSAEDVHLATAVQLQLVRGSLSDAIRRYQAGDKKVKDARSVAKGGTFLTIYGGTPEAASLLFHIDVNVVRDFQRRYFKRFSDATAWIHRTYEQVDRDKEVVSKFGRRRRLPLAGSGVNDARYHRLAVNSLIQGSLADLVGRALIRIAHRLETEFPGRARAVLTVHDSIVIEVVEEEAVIEAVARVVHEEMTRKPRPDFKVFFPVDLDVGRAWNNLSSYSFAA